MRYFCTLSSLLLLNDVFAFEPLINNNLDFSYVGALSGPSLEPSWATPILVGEDTAPSNLRNQVKLGYRLNENWSVGGLVDFTLSIDHQHNLFHDSALAVTKYGLLKTDRFSLDADFRVFFLKSQGIPSGLQSFQTTTYHFSNVPFSFYMYNLFHYELANNALVVSGFPILAYHYSSFIHPAMFIKSTGRFAQENRLLELVTGPGVVFTPTNTKKKDSLTRVIFGFILPLIGTEGSQRTGTLDGMHSILIEPI